MSQCVCSPGLDGPWGLEPGGGADPGSRREAGLARSPERTGKQGRAVSGLPRPPAPGSPSSRER